MRRQNAKKDITFTSNIACADFYWLVQITLGVMMLRKFKKKLLIGPNYVRCYDVT